jgi:hypothetical protein
LCQLASNLIGLFLALEGLLRVGSDDSFELLVLFTKHFVLLDKLEVLFLNGFHEFFDLRNEEVGFSELAEVL